MSFQARAQAGSESDDDGQPNDLVRVEHSRYEYKKVPGEPATIALQPYPQRRGNFGVHVALGFSQYQPGIVANNQGTTGDSVTYTSGQSPLAEATVSPKWNSPMGSLSLDLGGGYFENPSVAGGGAGLVVTMYRAGITWTLDTLGPEPVFAPYISGGLYEVDYNETDNGATNTATTSPAPYFGIGILFQLNWLEKQSGAMLYDETGIENTFAYLEARSFLRGDSSDPDFSSNLAFGAGLKIEF